MNSTPWLSDAEIDDMCEGLATNAARVRYLRRQGLTVTTKPNGRPLVMRAHAERVLSGLADVVELEAKTKTEPRAPNRDALVLAFTRKRA